MTHIEYQRQLVYLDENTEGSEIKHMLSSSTDQLYFIQPYLEFIILSSIPPKTQLFQKSSFKVLEYMLTKLIYVPEACNARTVQPEYTN